MRPSRSSGCDPFRPGRRAQARFCFNDMQSEFTCQLVANSVAPFWGSKSACGNHESCARNSPNSVRTRTPCTLHFLIWLCRKSALPPPALQFQQVDDVLCGTVAEELARVFHGKECDVFDESDEVRGRVPGQRGFREMFVRTDEFQVGNDVGELQRPPPEMRIFLHSIGKLEHGDTPATFAGFDRAESPAAPAPRTRASNFCVKNESHEPEPDVCEFPPHDPSRLNYVLEKTEKIASDHQLARTVKRYGAPTLPEYFSRVRRDRIGVIGPNGWASRRCWKCSRPVKPDSGDVAVRKGTRLSYVAQIPSTRGRDDSLCHRDWLSSVQRFPS